MKKISIIMPLYNAEKYLEETLKSVEKQIFYDYELICVDDGSNDSTVSILKKYKLHDDRIQIISNSERLGAAASRNKAITIAQGEYIVFFDGDDIYDETLLQEAYETAEKHNAEIVCYPLKIVSSEYIFNKTEIKHSKNYIDLLCTKPFKIENLKPHEYMNISSSPCDKIYKRKFIMEAGIEFQNLTSCNDVFFVNMALLLANRIIFLEKSNVMVYVRNHNTPTRISYDRDPMNAYLADIKTGQELIKRDRMYSVCQHYYFRVFCHLVETLNMTKNEDKAESFYDFMQKEGVENLRKLGGNFFDKIQEYIKGGFKKFENQNYSEEWFKDEGDFCFYLHENKETIVKLFWEWESKNIKVGLWGIGRQGRVFLNFCKDLQINIDEIMDRDKNKWNSVIHNYPAVSNPEDVLERVNVILLTSSNLVEEISSYIREKNFDIDIIDLNLYLGR